jgi:hypothetical protein
MVQLLGYIKIHPEYSKPRKKIKNTSQLLSFNNSISRTMLGSQSKTGTIGQQSVTTLV